MPVRSFGANSRNIHNPMVSNELRNYIARRLRSHTSYYERVNAVAGLFAGRRGVEDRNCV